MMKYDEACGFWKIKTVVKGDNSVIEYIGKDYA